METKFRLRRVLLIMAVTTFSDATTTSQSGVASGSAFLSVEVLNRTSGLQCIPTVVSACIAVFSEPYYIPVASREESETFTIIASISDPLDSFCNTILSSYACHFLTPPCNPDRGTQLGVCTNSCHILDTVNDQCRTQLDAIRNNSSGSFADFVINFDCTIPESYLIPGIPIDMENCLNAEEYFDITTGNQSHSTDDVLVPLTIFAAIMLVLIALSAVVIIACVCKKAKVIKYYQKWKLSSNERELINDMRSQVYQVENSRESVSLFSKDVPMASNATDGMDEFAKLSESDVKNYRAHFRHLVVPYSSLQFNESLGEGAFGKVYAGVVNDHHKHASGIPVAIKTSKNMESREQLNSFMAESLLMKDFNHTHVLGLLGVCLDAPDGSPCIILPFMANGSVKSYLKEKRTHVLDVDTFPKELSLEALLHMCIDIASGMKYLAEKKFVHRDLAARNCMLDSELMVKVGDFGLARDVYSADYYRAGKGARLPVKWMPPETLTDGMSNEKTDVWSFGVTCWEVFSLGRNPYPGIENHEILHHISTGGRLNVPTLCPEKLFSIISSCWQFLPEDRPNFESLHSSLTDYWDDEHLYI